MIKFHKTIDGEVIEIENLEKNCWINVENPSEADIDFLQNELNVKPDFIRSAMDKNITSHVKSDKTATLVIIESPTSEHEDDAEKASFYTLPVSFILFPDNIITISQEQSYVLSAITNDEFLVLDTANEVDFLLQTLHALAGRYIYYLRQIESLTLQSEKNLKDATKNKEILQLLNLQKSLVYFSTALSATKSTLDMLAHNKNLVFHEDDLELLENTQILFGQAIEQATIYSRILDSMMDAFSGVISNNLNTIMKVMTAITIVMTIPNIVFGFYGMNVDLPFAVIHSPIIIAVILIVIVAFILYKNDFFE